VAAVKVAVLPLGVRVPPAGDALQVTAPEQEALAFTVAVNVAVAPVTIVAGLPLTVTLVTVQVLPPPPLPPPLLPPPQLDTTTTANTVDTESASHLPTSHDRRMAPSRPGAIFNMIRPSIRRFVSLTG
jgi:hypothetical protein